MKHVKKFISHFLHMTAMMHCLCTCVDLVFALTKSSLMMKCIHAKHEFAKKKKRPQPKHSTYDKQQRAPLFLFSHTVTKDWVKTAWRCGTLYQKHSQIKHCLVRLKLIKPKCSQSAQESLLFLTISTILAAMPKPVNDRWTTPPPTYKPVPSNCTHVAPSPQNALAKLKRPHQFSTAATLNRSSQQYSGRHHKHQGLF